MRITDGKKKIKIEIVDENRVDWSEDFFEAGLLKYNEEKEAYEVPDIDYCVEQAMEYIAEDSRSEVEVKEIE